MTATIVERPFVKYRDDYNDNVLRKARETGLSEADCILIMQFIKSKAGTKLSDSRKRALVSKLAILRRYLDVGYTEATPNDLLELCDRMSKDYKPNTCNESKSVLKEFYRYLIREKKTTITIEHLKDIQKEKVADELTPGDMLTVDDITKMLNTTPNPMHKALIALLAESGGRVHEIARLKWKDLQFDSLGCVLSLMSKKTTQRRFVRLHDSVPYLSMWKSVHPSPVPESYVFVTERGTVLIYETIRATLDRIANKAGIEKHITPHLFRHSRVTELLKLGMREPELKKSLWGSVSTKMLARYEHLAGGSIDAEYKRIYGIEDQDDKPKPMLSSIQCSSCHTINRGGASFCMTCGLPLNAEARLSQDRAIQITDNKLMESVVNDPEFAALVNRKYTELQKQKK